jgi:hypothetical protein
MRVFIGVLVLCFSLDALTQSNSALRDPKQVAAFKKLNACPATGKIQRSCPDYVVDHIDPLCAGGADHPDNMMYMRVADAKKKDRVEHKLCKCMGTVK